MTALRTALLIVASFALGTSATSLVASRRIDWSSPEFLAAAASAFLLCAWLLSTRVRMLRESPRVSPLGLALMCNVVLLGLVTYFALGVRQQRYWLESRVQAALSLISPRLLPPAVIIVQPYSREPLPGYRSEVCIWPGQRPGYLGSRLLTVEVGIEDVSIETTGGETVLLITFRQGCWNVLSEFTQSHPGHRIAFVAGNNQVLLDIPVDAPIREPYLRLAISGAGLDRLTAERFRLWFRRNPPIAA